MPLQATSGAASYDAFGGGVPVEPVYIEQIFSTWLYTGNSSTQTITNGIDLAGKGGLVWLKKRTAAVQHELFDTARGVSVGLSTDATYANDGPYAGFGVTAFNASGYSLGGAYASATNDNTYPYASWTFRKQPKFFDVVTYTGNGSSPKTISHNLGSTPGCIIIKRTDSTGDWWTYHNSLTVNQYLKLNTTAALATSAGIWGSGPTSTAFTVNAGALNASGGTYVAYLFAHNAGGFGLAGTDNVISCGSYTGTGSAGNAVTLGYEPQWLLIKNITSGTQSWRIFDSMRGFTTDGTDATLFPNSSSAEASLTLRTAPTATGFIQTGSDNGENATGDTYIYIAIRRGPMKVPTDGTAVFSPALGQSPNPNYVSGFPVDFAMSEYRVNGSNSTGSRLQGSNVMDTASTGAENSDGSVLWDFMNGYYTGGRSSSFVSWMFRRAPGFFDEVCYTGTGSARTVAHNLAAVPELMIVKCRSSAQDWSVYHASLGDRRRLTLNSTAADSLTSQWGNTTPTSSVFSLGLPNLVNGSGLTYVAYLFASCPGVSKCGSYTGTGTTQQINCGFTAGARFVLIKRTDSTGAWYVWDSARGIVSGNDPYLLLNSTAAEVTSTDYIDTAATGFEISSTAPAEINASGGTFIFLAIA